MLWVAIHSSARGMVTGMTRPLGSTVHGARSPHLHYAQVRVKRCSAGWCKDLSEGAPYPSTSHQPLMQRAFIFGSWQCVPRPVNCHCLLARVCRTRARLRPGAPQPAAKRSAPRQVHASCTPPNTFDVCLKCSLSLLNRIYFSIL